MAVVKIKQTYVEGGEDENGPTYELGYWVQTDDRRDGPLTVRAAMPWRYGDVYRLSNTERDPLARCISIRETQLSSGHMDDWQVVVSFGQIENQNDNPLAEPLKMSWAQNNQQRRFYRDRLNKIIADPVGIPYADGIEEEDLLPIINYSMNVATYPFAISLLIRNATNATAWKLFGPKTVKITSMPADREFHPKYGVYYGAQWGFAINPDGMQPKVWAKSYFYKDGTKIKPFMEGDPLNQGDPKTGYPASQPQAVDLTGKPATTPVEQTIQLRPELDFNSLFAFLV